MKQGFRVVRGKHPIVRSCSDHPLRGLPRQQFQFRASAALAVLLVQPLLSLGQSSKAASLNNILQPTASVRTNGLVEIEFRNQGSKGITAFRYARIDHYADGKQAVYAKAGGVDFLGSTVARFAAPGESGGRLQPNHVFTQTFSAPGAPNGSRLLSVDVTVTALSFADRTALGDPRAIKAILSARRQDVARADAGLAEARSILGKPDPKAAVAARLAQIRKSGNRAASHSILEMLFYALSRNDPTLVQKVLTDYDTRRQALSTHSTLRGENQ